MTDEARPRVHRHELRVYFEDTDASGAAYHASYIRWAERARTESLRALGMPHQEMMEQCGALLVVRRIEVEYWRPARLDEALVVETSIRRVTGAAVEVLQEVRRDTAAAAAAAGGDAMPPDAGAGEAVARLLVGLVCIGRESGRPVPLPEPWRSALRDLVPAVPDRPGGGGRGSGLQGRARAGRRDGAG